MREEFKKIGKDLFLHGMVSSHGGNLSVRVGDRILITRRGSMLNHLEDRDVVETGLERNDSGIILASTEIGVHRAIYKATSALAVVHCHPVYTVAISLAADEIIPVDSEGSYILHKVPVVAAEHTAGSKEVERIVPEVLRQYKVVVLRGHGIFSAGQLLEEAFQYSSVLEVSAKMLYLTSAMKAEIKEYRKASGQYGTW